MFVPLRHRLRRCEVGWKRENAGGVNARGRAADGERTRRAVVCVHDETREVAPAEGAPCFGVLVTIDS